MTTKTRRVYIAIALLLAASLLALGLKALKPKAKKGRTKPSIPIVSTLQLSPKTYQIMVETNGTVIPARQVELVSEVEGVTLYVSPDLVPGGLIKSNDLLLRIDPTGYDLDIRSKRALVAEAKLNLELEKAQQGIARREWENVSDGSLMRTNKSLALREPHLENALARLDAARSSLEAAMVAKEKTVIKSPFNALVLERSISKGQLVTRQKPIAMLVDTDKFWVQASIPLEMLRWIKFPDGRDAHGSSAEIVQALGAGKKARRNALTYKLHGELDPKGRMAKVLFSITDPLCLKGCGDMQDAGRLLLGSFVDIQVDAGDIEGAFSIPRSALRDNNTVWILDSGSKLEIRDVEIAWHRKDDVLVTAGLSQGERLITSSLQSPMPGMDLMQEGQKTPATKAGAANAR